MTDTPPPSRSSFDDRVDRFAVRVVAWQQARGTEREDRARKAMEEANYAVMDAWDALNAERGEWVRQSDDLARALASMREQRDGAYERCAAIAGVSAARSATAMQVAEAAHDTNLAARYSTAQFAAHQISTAIRALKGTTP